MIEFVGSFASIITIIFVVAIYLALNGFKRREH